MYCNKCFEEIPDGSTRCPYCGADLKTVSKGKKKSGGGLFGGAKKNKRSPGGQQVDETWNIMGNNSYANDNYDPGMQGGEMYGGGGMQGGEKEGAGDGCGALRKAPPGPETAIREASSRPCRAIREAAP